MTLTSTASDGGMQQGIPPYDMTGSVGWNALTFHDPKGA